MKVFKRLKVFALAITMAANQLVNALTGGSAQMPVSARAGYAREAGSRTGRVTCSVLDALDPRDGDAPEGDHCDIAIRNYEQRLREMQAKLKR